MTALQEQLPLFEKEQTHYTQDPNFKHFVRNMFNENCKERRENGQQEYKNIFSYFRANHQFVIDKFKKRRQNKMVKETHKLIQDNKSNEYKLVNDKGQAVVELGTTDLTLAKKRSLEHLQGENK